MTKTCAGKKPNLGFKPAAPLPSSRDITWRSQQQPTFPYTTLLPNQQREAPAELGSQTHPGRCRSSQPSPAQPSPAEPEHGGCPGRLSHPPVSPQIPVEARTHLAKSPANACRCFQTGSRSHSLERRLETALWGTVFFILTQSLPEIRSEKLLFKKKKKAPRCELVGLWQPGLCLPVPHSPPCLV